MNIPSNTQIATIRLRTQARLMLGDEIALGPGKADLLDAIQLTGSISAAGKHLGMSYRRAWVLVDTMNRCFLSPVVETAKGGTQGGGAQVTALGLELLREYRELQDALNTITQTYSQHLSARLRSKPLPAKP